jgi:hypothetical protein
MRSRPIAASCRSLPSSRRVRGPLRDVHWAAGLYKAMEDLARPLRSLFFIRAYDIALPSLSHCLFWATANALTPDYLRAYLPNITFDPIYLLATQVNTMKRKQPRTSGNVKAACQACRTSKTKVSILFSSCHIFIATTSPSQRSATCHWRRTLNCLTFAVRWRATDMFEMRTTRSRTLRIRHRTR